MDIEKENKWKYEWEWMVTGFQKYIMGERW